MRRHSLKSGFTLTEVLIVVVILALLVSILMAFGRRLKEQANEKLCKSTIQVLIAAIEQYYDYHSEFPVPHYIYPPPLAPHPREGLLPIENLYNQLNSLSNSRKLCEQIQASQLGDTNGLDPTTQKIWIEFLDPWGNPLEYQFQGSYDVSGNYIPVWTFPRVVSGGPDGDLTTTVDNISSK